MYTLFDTIKNTSEGIMYVTHFNINYMRAYISKIAVYGMADPENIALGRPAQQKGSDRYPTSGASRAVDGLFDAGPNNKNCAQVRYVWVNELLHFTLSGLLFCWTPVLKSMNFRALDTW